MPTPRHQGAAVEPLSRDWCRPRGYPGLMPSEPYAATREHGVHNGIGRPCALTPETAAEIVRAFRLGATVKIAAGAAGVNEATFYRWMTEGRRDAEAGESSIFRDFCDEVNRARNRGDLELLASVKGTTQGRRCPTCQGRGAVPSHEVGGRADDQRLVRCPACKGSTFSTAPDGRLALDLLSRRHPADYGRQDNHRHEVTGDGGGPVRIDVRAIAAAVDLDAIARTLGAGDLDALAWDGDEVAAIEDSARRALPARRDAVDAVDADD